MFSKLSHITNFPYTPAGRLCSKLQDFTGTGNVYAYSPNSKQHAVRRIYDPTTTNLRQMLWDANGNIAQIAEYLYDATNQQTFLQDFRNHYWDEDDRLNLVLDNSHFSYYLYGNDGQRVSKLTGSAFSLGTGFATNALLDNYTLYPSEYLVITQQGYTKYYYANVTRIASRLGSGGFEKMTRLCTLDQNLTYNANTLFNSVVARVGEDMPQEYVSDPCPAYNKDMAGFRVPLQPLNFEPNFGITAQQNVLQAFRQNYVNEETYYFHGNHLGSANWVTLQNASPTQFLLHLPYGEEFVKQLSGSYDERFTFTGKEKDLETGYYYFGARFDNVDLGFMSVDPMSDKYPSISPYAYCAWNPVKYVDPEGMKFDTSQDEKYVKPMEADIKIKLSERVSMRDKYKIGTDEYNRLNEHVAELSNALNEIKDLRDDNNNLYYLTFGESIFKHNSASLYADADGCISYGGTLANGVNIIYIKMADSYKYTTSTMLHEFKHAHQYYLGELGFYVDANGEQVGSSNNQVLEKAANYRGSIYDFSNQTNYQNYKLNEYYNDFPSEMFDSRAYIKYAKNRNWLYINNNKLYEKKF